MDQAYLDARRRLDRLDDSCVVGFFAAASGVLLEAGLCSDKDAEDLRIALMGLQDVGERPTSALVQLIEQDVTILSILVARFGEAALCRNLLRHTMRPWIIEAKTYVASLGNQLLDRSRLYFNREVFIVRRGRVEKQVLASALLVDCAAVLARCRDMIEDLENHFAKFIPHSMAEISQESPEDSGVDHAEIDRKMAECLGFHGVDYSSYPELADSYGRRSLGFAIESVAEAIEHLSRAIGDCLAGTGSAKTTASTVSVDVMLEALRSGAARISGFALFETAQLSHIRVIEPQRQAFLQLFFEANYAIRSLGRTSLELIDILKTQGSTAKPETSTPISDEVSRRIAADLLADGVAPKEVQSATEGLGHYLQKHGVEASKLLTSELRKIHPSLGERALTILKESEPWKSPSDLGSPQTNATGKRTTEKQRILKTADTLRKVFGKSLKQASKHAAKGGASGTTLLLLLALPLLGVWSGCGVKGAPVSEAVNTRPDIPFRSNALRPNISKSNTDKSNTDKPDVGTPQQRRSTSEGKNNG